MQYNIFKDVSTKIRKSGTYLLMKVEKTGCQQQHNSLKPGQLTQ